MSNKVYNRKPQPHQHITITVSKAWSTLNKTLIKQNIQELWVYLPSLLPFFITVYINHVPNQKAI